MSEWKAGSDNEESDVEEQPRVYKRLTKSEKQKIEDESEYQDGGSSSSSSSTNAKKQLKSKFDNSSDEEGSNGASVSIYDKVRNYISDVESKLGVVGSKASITCGSGLTPDLATQPMMIETATLHPHQQAGLNWIKSRFQLGLNAILADEMGLGKTLQSISFLSYLQEVAVANASLSNAGSTPISPRVGPFLIICPLTVLDNWMNELNQFAPSLLSQSYFGSKVEREETQDEIKCFIRTQPKAERKDPMLPFHVLVTTYECILNDVEFLAKFRWRAAIIDEAHRLKNAESILSQTLVNDYQIAWKLLLTGTPVQNNLSELWSLLYFLNPRLFQNRKRFLSEFELLSSSLSKQTKDAQQFLTEEEKVANYNRSMEHLHELLRPWILRRMKSECDLDIPPKREIILKTNLTAIQKDIYKNLLLKNYDMIGSNSSKNSRALLNIVQGLRKCATHPYLFPGVEPEPFIEGPHIYEASGKFALLHKLLRVLKKQKRRVLLFSTSVQTLDIVQDALTQMKYTYERLDGSVRGEERYLAIERFTNNPKTGAGKQPEETFVFLLSTRAGGVGLNLTVADVVIFLDADWNPQADLQAQSRCHRIGQKKEVLIIRLVASNTVEEIIQKRTMKKLLMTHNILEKGRFNLKQQQQQQQQQVDEDEEKKEKIEDENDTLGRSAQDLKNILQYGLDHLFVDGSASTGSDELKEDEIEAIITGKLDQPAAATKNGAGKGASSAAEARNRFNRITSTALPSLEEASVDVLTMDTEEPSVYVYEGQNYKELANDQLDDIEEELETSAAAGEKALQRIFAASAKDRNIDDLNYDSPAEGSSSRKRKSLEQLEESAEEREARIQRNKELAKKRMESARKKKEEAERALQEKWAQFQYVSTSIELDEALQAEWEQQASKNALSADQNQVTQEPASEWGIPDDEEAGVAEGGSKKAKLAYVVGDATCPFSFEREDGISDSSHASAGSSAAASSSASEAQPTTSPSSALVFIPVDASGKWGKGGLFRALDNRSSLIGEQYELMGEMDDLAMADVHVVSLDSNQLRAPSHTSFPPATPASLHVGLAAVLKRGKNQSYGPPSLQTENLSTAFQKAAQYARKNNMSVHLPRINDSNIQWYAIERMLNKHIVSLGVNVFVYYFQRRRPQYRSPVKTPLDRTNASFSQRTMSSQLDEAAATSAVSSAALVTAVAETSTQPMQMDDDAAISSEPQPPQPSLSILSQFHDVFTGCTIYIHSASSSSAASDERLLTRFITAYDGQVVKELSSKVTHIVTAEPFLTPALLDAKKQASSSVRIVQIAWVEKCVKQGQRDESSKFQVAAAPKN